MADLINVIAAQPYFADFRQDHIQLLAGLAQPVEYKAGQFLLRYQQTADTFWLLRSGQVVLLNHIPGSPVRAIETISAPGLVGWSWLLPPYLWHFDVCAQTSVSALTFDAIKLRKAMAENSAFASRLYPCFMAVMLDRLQAARLQGLDIYRAPKGRVL